MRRQPATVLFIGTCLVLFLTGTAMAEEEQEETRRWKDTAEFSAVMTTGNSENTTVSAANKYTYNWENSELTVDASFLRTETTDFDIQNIDGEPVVTANEKVSAENYSLGVKYRKTIKDGFLWYATTGWIRNRINGIDDRYTVGAGVGYRFLESDRNKLVGEIGLGYSDESRVDGTQDSYSDARGFLGYERAMTKTSTFTSELEVLENLDDSEDLRMRSVSSVTASISQKIALKVSYKIEYDHQPVVITLAGDPDAIPPVPDATYEFEDTDTTLSASLVINF